MNTGMTTMEVKIINKHKVYTYIYEEKTTSKAQISLGLQMGLSTVTSNLKLLEEEGFIQRNGFYHSTGGRKANAISIVANARISIGVAILKHSIDLVATDLYGKLIVGKSYPLSFSCDTAYYHTVCDSIHNFIHTNKLDKNLILGISFAIQGIVSEDGTSITYGQLLNNESMSIKQFQDLIPYPCRLEHDSKAAAELELWNHKNIECGIVFLLNRNMGGAIISHGHIVNGSHMRSGLVEHMTLHPDGTLCYCGKKGCFETYCSGAHLEEISHMSLTEFFSRKNKKDTTCQKIWQGYLNNLALGICNASVIIDGSYLLSGYLSTYFTSHDYDYLLSRINELTPFTIDADSLIISSNGTYAQAMGTSLFYTKDFLTNI